MVKTDNTGTFLTAFGIRPKDVVSIIGAGGKTSLMFYLAREAKNQGMRVLVTTSTRIRVPEESQYDSIDLSGKLFSDREIQDAGVYVGGLPAEDPSKITGVRSDLLAYQCKKFDLVLIEADGAAEKPLKGWKSTEPVIADFTSTTIGVVDIQTIGKQISEDLVHRLEIFSQITGADEGENVQLGHLLRMIVHNKGLFGSALGREILFINKVESAMDIQYSNLLQSQMEGLLMIAGSVHEATICE